MSNFQHIYDGLACFNQDIAFQLELDGQVISHFRADAQLHIASAYKTIVAVACTHAIGQKRFDWATSLLLTPQERVPDSPITDVRRDGEKMTVAELMHAMIAVSDNTATQLLQSHLGQEALSDVLQAYGLRQTQVPHNLHLYHKLAEQGVAATHSIAALSTAHDLVQCYDLALEDPQLPAPDRARFWRIMQAEDRHQQKTWGDGITCFRKSGFLEIAPFYAMSLAGMLVSPHHRFTFAFINNFEQNDPQEAESKLIAFQQCLKQILNQLDVYLMTQEGA